MKHLFIGACICMTLLGARATTITLTTMDVSTDTYAVGDVVPGVDYGQFGGNIGGDTVMANQLVSMAVSTTFIGVGQSVSGGNVLYTRTANTFGFASPQTQMPSVAGTILDGGGLQVSQITVPIGSNPYYLVAKYDGPQGGAQVWDISSLVGGDVINLPSTAWGKGMTGYALFSGAGVPDGGTTLCLLGVALSGLGLLRRKL